MDKAGDNVDLLGMLPEEIEVFLQALGHPPYRARQLFSWLHRGAAFEEMTDLPRGIRSRLAGLARPGTLSLVDRLEAPDRAAKFGFQTADGHTIETVLIPHRNRTTVCVSSQIGCAFACPFCATGQRGLTRSLHSGEIVEQVVQVQKAIRPTRVSNLVFMGMGEPLANYDAVLKAIRLLNSEHGLAIGARHIAISTCGLPNEIRRLAREGIQVALAISLHAATDDVRDRLVPINRKYNIAEVMAAARHFAQETGRKVAFEYVVVPGANDTPEQARELARLLRVLPSMVNLIPRNPIEEGGRADPDAAFRFAAFLERHGLEAVVRRSRGAEVLGACGQLASRAAGKKKAGREASRPARAKG
ncbi:MAG TPA: 23S rRNA (adenine(2503)-C(2))-methyltransferase RlmN [Armatimonadota bacterium]|nr:23S rRNA (adenine(2503)-C(2))-methyltransferase RlmN [Armatimonadota bacterium]